MQVSSRQIQRRDIFMLHHFDVLVSRLMRYAAIFHYLSPDPMLEASE
jgi:hypothetical protein